MFSPEKYGLKAGAAGYDGAKARLVALRVAQEQRLKGELLGKAYRAQRISVPSGKIGGAEAGAGSGASGGGAADAGVAAAGGSH